MLSSQQNDEVSISNNRRQASQLASEATFYTALCCIESAERSEIGLRDLKSSLSLTQDWIGPLSSRKTRRMFAYSAEASYPLHLPSTTSIDIFRPMRRSSERKGQSLLRSKRAATIRHDTQLLRQADEAAYAINGHHMPSKGETAKGDVRLCYRGHGSRDSDQHFVLIIQTKSMLL